MKRHRDTNAAEAGAGGGAGKDARENEERGLDLLGSDLRPEETEQMGGLVLMTASL